MCIYNCIANPSERVLIAYDLCAPGIGATVVPNKINTHRNANLVMSNVVCPIVELYFVFHEFPDLLLVI